MSIPPLPPFLPPSRPRIRPSVHPSGFQCSSLWALMNARRTKRSNGEGRTRRRSRTDADGGRWTCLLWTLTLSCSWPCLPPSPAPPPPPPPPLQFVRARQGRLTSFRLANFLDYLPVESSKAPTYPLLPPTQTPRLFLPCRVPSHLDGYLFFGLHRMVLALHFAPLLHIFKLFERMLTEFEFQFLWHVSYPSSEPIYLVAQKDQIQETNS